MWIIVEKGKRLVNLDAAESIFVDNHTVRIVMRTFPQPETKDRPPETDYYVIQCESPKRAGQVFQNITKTLKVF